MTQDLLSRYFTRTTQLPAHSSREWEDLLGQARQTALIGRLALQLDRDGMLEQVPPRPRKHLQAALRVIARQRREISWEVECIASAIQQIDTPVVLLKGAAYLVADLPPSTGRLFSDVDIMVASHHLPAVENALFAAGWLSEARDAYTNRYYRTWMHELPPMRHVRRGTTIDVHHTISPPTSRFAVEGSRLLARLTPLPGKGRLFTLSREDLVLHSATHLFMEGELWHGLRDLLDINDLILAFSLDTGFWEQMLQRATELGLEVPLSHAVVHIERLFGTRPPPSLQGKVRDLDRSLLSRHLMYRLLAIAIRPEHPSCNGTWSDSARFLLYLRSHYLRMPMHQLLPHLTRKTYLRFEKKPAL